jgi:hypothetical protein
MSAMNEMLLAKNQELEAELDAKCQEKIGKYLINFSFNDHASELTHPIG